METRYVWDNTANYNFEIGKNDITVLVGSSTTQSVEEQLAVSGDAGKEHYYSSTFYDTQKIGQVQPLSEYDKGNQLSYFGRLHYVYDDKYILTASIRRDGQSTLATGHKWGNFPSVAAGWRVTEENFMKGTQSWLSNLKLRLSYGVTGNAAIKSYQTLPNLSAQMTYYYIGGKDVPGYLPSHMGNTGLKWESTAATNFAVDFAFLNSRVSGSIDYYLTNTYDLLYNKISPASSIFPTVVANVGDTKGSGLEVALNTRIVETKDFQYSVDWTYFTGKDEVVSLTGGIDRNITGVSGQIVGEPVSMYYDYQADGIWNVGEFDEFKAAWEARHPGESLAYIVNYGTPGTLKMKDVDDNGKIDDDDKKVYNRDPKHIFSMSNNFTYRNLSLSVLLYASWGNYMSYGLNNQFYFEGNWTNWGDLDYWTPDNTDARFPSPGSLGFTGINNGAYKTSLTYEKADFFKIKDITLSYNLPKVWMKSAKINNVRIYGSLKNFFTFSAVGGYDSERGGSISFPLSKQAVVGFNVQF
jgi:TonB-linked SusC/RagA family outer membrane protein